MIPREFFQVDFHFIFFEELKNHGLKESIIVVSFYCCAFILTVMCLHTPTTDSER
jgi:hypothetical protein